MDKLIPILKNEKEILNHMRKNLPPFSKDFICFYSSFLNAFITDPLFISIPLEDKIVHRGYSVFETTKIFENKIYQLDKHIDRLIKSIGMINLKSMYNSQEYRNILVKLSSIARKIEPEKDIELRFFYSAGLGNMSLTVNENMNSFYAIALRTDYSIRPINGVEERLVFIDNIKKNIQCSKNTNYLMNCMVCRQSKVKGGYLGIIVDEDGNMLEGPMSNIAFVTKNGDFNVPPFDKTLIGTTVIRLFDYVSNELIPKGLIKSINRDYINIKNIENEVKEAMHVGGDFVIPLLKIDEITITDEPGQITKMLQNFLLNDKKTDEVTEDIPEYEWEV